MDDVPVAAHEQEAGLLFFFLFLFGALFGTGLGPRFRFGFGFGYLGSSGRRCRLFLGSRRFLRRLFFGSGGLGSPAHFHLRLGLVVALRPWLGLLSFASVGLGPLVRGRLERVVV
ncbi:MAG: hypothetical protein ACRDJ4_01800 [Actinomycetota bacterium]